MATPSSLDSVVAEATELAYDVDLSAVRAWKSEAPGRFAIGCLPVYVPRELLWAAGALPVSIFGGGDRLSVVRGDAYFQSYICHIPRSIVEMGVSGRLDVLDGCIFPATCDVIRNLCGMWQVLFPGKLARYLDVPQCFEPEVGGRFFHHDLTGLRRDLETLVGRRIGNEDVRRAIGDYDAVRKMVADLLQIRAETPHNAPLSETYVVLRAGAVLPPCQHKRLVRRYIGAALSAHRAPFDTARIVLVGGFCEQPPLGLLRTLERAGCDVVSDDLLLGLRWHQNPIPDEPDPLWGLARAFIEGSPRTASVYSSGRKGEDLVETVRRTKADGVVFCAPSFCDPALLDRPMLAATLDRHGIPHTEVKYSEDTAQFQGLKEQAGTFSDALKLWSVA